MEGGLFNQARALQQTHEVGMGEVRFAAFQPGDISCIGTANLNGCTVVTIISGFGAILAHIPPRPNKDFDDPHAGDRNVQEKMDEVAALYNQYQAYFPTESPTGVVSAIYRGEMALPAQVAIIERNLQQMGLRNVRADYIVLGPDEPRRAGQGTVFIDARGGSPIVYVEDRPVSV